MPVKSQFPIPAGKERLIPHLICDPCSKAIDFYKAAFGAEEVYRMPSPEGRILHAELRIGGSPLFLADDFPEFSGGKSSSPKALRGTPVTLHRYVDNCDAAITRAKEAGAKVTMPAADMFWGDRYGVIEDPFGHSWAFATHREDLTPDEVRTAMKTAFAK
jgi:uncharacterized glyoxalase superfamily protein PhnB